MSAWQVCSLLVAAAALCGAARAQEPVDPARIINFIVIGDPHLYTNAPRNVPQVIERINALPIQPDFVISMGDNIAGGEDHEVLADARTYHDYANQLSAPHYYVIGNHECIPVEVYQLLTWDELLGAWEMDSRWYSFDVRGFHVIVIDGWISLRSDKHADVLKAELAWLAADLEACELPTMVFVHQAIGFQQADSPSWIATDNRKFWPPGNPLETVIQKHADKIVGVFEGHKHASLWKTCCGVTYHQIGASFIHDGQFAQVFIDAQTRRFFVLGHPERDERDEAWSIQQTYGDRRLMEALQR